MFTWYAVMDQGVLFLLNGEEQFGVCDTLRLPIRKMDRYIDPEYNIESTWKCNLTARTIYISRIAYMKTNPIVRQYAPY